jgi:hypothetical protein
MFRNVATALTMVLTLAAVASAAPKQARHADGDHAMSSHRAAAMHECNEKSTKLLQYLWGVTQLEVYQSCMAGHGEMN